MKPRPNLLLSLCLPSVDFWGSYASHPEALQPPIPAASTHVSSHEAASRACARQPSRPHQSRSNAEGARIPEPSRVSRGCLQSKPLAPPRVDSGMPTSSHAPAHPSASVPHAPDAPDSVPHSPVSPDFCAVFPTFCTRF